MSSGRLQQQFIRLWQCCDGKSQETTLNELAEMLSCSRRHMRTLLNMMESRGWLTWEAEAGRGKRSRLTFIYTGLALQQQRAEDLLEQDRIDQLVQLVGDKAAVRQMLVSHLGRSFRQGRHILRVLYYRPMKNLLPGSALRRSETHIARQIFSALTRVNEENGELEADIAHHWQQLTPTHWRFFLRPGIHFHHGRELEMADVIASLQRSNALPLYSHIERIESPTAWTLDIHLRQPDRWLPWLLGQVPAMVLPQWVAALFGTWLIPRYSDRTGERCNIAALTLLAAAVGIAVSGLVAPVLAIIALCVAAVGVIAVQPVFWTMPTQLLSGTALAAGIGFVNLFGAIGGFLAPIVRVQAETLFASSAAGLLTLAGVAIVGVVIIFSLSLTRAVPQRGSVQR